jgi:hypothetical protein
MKMKTDRTCWDEFELEMMVLVLNPKGLFSFFHASEHVVEFHIFNAGFLVATTAVTVECGLGVNGNGSFPDHVDVF